MSFPKSIRKLCEELGLFLVVATTFATNGFLVSRGSNAKEPIRVCSRKLRKTECLC